MDSGRRHKNVKDTVDVDTNTLKGLWTQTQKRSRDCGQRHKHVKETVDVDTNTLKGLWTLIQTH